MKKRRRTVTLVLTGLLAVALLSSCTRVKVKVSEFEDEHPLLNPSVLGKNKPSQISRQFLRTHFLENAYQKTPTTIIETLEQNWRNQHDRDALGVAAELSFIQARRLGDGEEARQWYLLTAARAWTYLFSNDSLQDRRLFDPRAQQMVTLYNLSVARGVPYFRDNQTAREHLRCAFTVGQNRLELSLHLGEDTVDPRIYSSFIPTEEVSIRGLTNVHQIHGLGATLAAYRENRQETPQETFYPPEGITAPLTALFAFRQTTNGYHGELAFFDPRNTHVVQVGEENVPLAGDFTTHYAYLLSQAELEKLGRQGLFRPEKAESHLGIFLLEPYDPDKIPLLMVHGLFSSPQTWINLTNEINGDPILRDRYQIWHYMYPTALPYLYSGYLFRQQLVAAQQTFDPHLEHGTFDQLVIVAHSMGGLLCKTLVTDPKDQLHGRVFRKPLEELKVNDDHRMKLREIFQYQPCNQVARIIFIAVPHRGSHLADGFLGNIGRRLANIPSAMTELFTKITGDNIEHMDPDMLAIMSAGGPSSISALSPKHPLLKTFSEVPIQSGIPYHSIIGDRGRGDGPNGSDGVVPYSSAHLEGAVSEVIVPTGHSCHEHPLAVQEVKRILYLHLRER